MLSEIFAVLGQTLSIYSFLLIIWILLTWFPGIDWSNGVLSALTSITDPYLNIFRGIIPPIGGFDISSLLAFLLLNVIQNLITNLQYASLGYSWIYLSSPEPLIFPLAALNFNFSRFCNATSSKLKFNSVQRFDMYHNTSPNSFLIPNLDSLSNIPFLSLITFLTYSATSPASPTKPSVG